MELLPDRPIFEEFPEWNIEPVAVGCTDTTTAIGWTATTATNDGRNIHTVGAPTIIELRCKLREIRDRTTCGPSRLPAT